MPLTRVLLAGFILSLTMAVASEAAYTEIGTAIEQFVQHRFPNAREHFWVVNQATVEEDEVTVDVSAVVRIPPQETPIAERFLLLIVRGEVAAAQLVPPGSEPDCRPEET